MNLETRKRVEFENMDHFFKALEKNMDAKYKNTQLETTRRIFDQKEVDVGTLKFLNDTTLQKIGFNKLGLRIAILSTLVGADLY
jgi:hypothetical protein